MSAEITNPQIDKILHQIVLRNNYLLPEARRKDLWFLSRIHGDVFSNLYPIYTQSIPNEIRKAFRALSWIWK